MSVSPPRPSKPRLNSLRAFESAARLGGFKAAAEELSVTPGAISQHIKLLEEWTGTDLFERKTHGVALTDLGASAADQFTEAFNVLGGAIRKLRLESTQDRINIATLPSIAQLWLSSRMPAVRTILPQQTLSITALEQPPNMMREMFDLSLFFCDEGDTQVKHLLSPDIIFPVCTAEIAARLNRIEDLLSETRLYDTTWSSDWELWAAQCTPGISFPQDGPSFSLYSLALEEAKNGAGILMGHEVLLAPLLRSGELVAPFKQTAHTGKSLCIYHPEELSPQSPIAILVEQLKRSAHPV